MKFISLLFLITLALAQKVNVTAKVESLCPDTIRFFTRTMNEIRKHQDIMDVIDFNIIPYGKAVTISRSPPTFTCQHGNAECNGNIILNCGLKYIPKNQLAFTICLAERFSYTEDDVRACASEAGATDGMTESILSCSKGMEGLQLHLEAGDKTGSIFFVPFITVNNKFIGTNPSRLLPTICKALPEPVPESCKSVLAIPGLYNEDKKYRHPRKHNLAANELLTQEERSELKNQLKDSLKSLNRNSALSPDEKQQERINIRKSYRALLLQTLEKKLSTLSQDDPKKATIEQTINKLKTVGFERRQYINRNFNAGHRIISE
ncbi:hypothetical protein WA158_005767 [Blastocystis sp. Blastoise]